MVRQGIRRMLSDCDGIEIVSEAGGGLEAIEVLTKTKPDLVLLDVILPEIDGIQVLKEIRRRLPDTKVLIVSAVETDYSVRTAVESSADGYLPKQATREDMIAAIRKVMAGETFLPSDLAGGDATPRPTPPLLTPKQIKVLKLISEGASNKEIGLAMGITQETVKSHVSEILRRLDAKDRTSAVTRAMQERLI